MQGVMTMDLVPSTLETRGPVRPPIFKGDGNLSEHKPETKLPRCRTGLVNSPPGSAGADVSSLPSLSTGRMQTEADMRLGRVFVTRKFECPHCHKMVMPVRK